MIEKDVGIQPSVENNVVRAELELFPCLKFTKVTAVPRLSEGTVDSILICAQY